MTCPSERQLTDADLRENPRYAQFFECFNDGRYFEAHDVLEVLWLPVRGLPAADYFKGLIQLAGAFVHERKGRVQPALALLRLATRNLTLYAPAFLGLEIESVLRQIAGWSAELSQPGVAQVANRPMLRPPSISAPTEIRIDPPPR